MKQYDWSADDRYRSDGGDGPLTARITHVVNGAVHMRRWHGWKEPESGNAVHKFELSAKVFFGGLTGWVKKEAEDGK